MHELIERTFNRIIEESKRAKIILLHPDSRYRSMSVARLVQDDTIPTYYYAFGVDDINLKNFISSTTHHLANQHPTFGRHLNLLPPKVQRDFNTHFDVVLQAFVRELDELSDEPFFFILDEFDKADDADDVQRFVERLSNFSPEQCTIVMNSRELPRLPWVSMITRHHALLLKDDEIIKENFYDFPVTDNPELEVYALGPGYILLNNEYIDDWEGHLPRLLLFFAIDRPVVTRSEICEAFWPDLDIEQAVNVFHVTKRRLHKAMGLDVLVHDGQYYRINPEIPVYYDSMEFVDMLMAGRYDNLDEEFTLWQSIANLYRGPFLHGHDDQWILERRESFLQGYVEALNHIARIRLENGQQELAINIYQQALSADDTREELHRHLMQLYIELGRNTEAAIHYQALVKRLKKAKQEPEDATRTLYEEQIANA